MLSIGIQVFCSLMELMTLWYLCRFILGKSKYAWPVCLGVFLLTGLASVGVALYLPRGSIKVLINILVVFLPMILFNGSLLMKVFTLGLLAAIGGCTEQAVKAMLVIINGGISVVDASIGKYIQGAVLSKFLALALVRLLMSFRKNQRKNLSGWAILELIIYPLATILVMSQLMAPNYYVEDHQAYIKAFLVAGVLVVANILMFHVFERQAEQEEDKIKLALMQRQQEEQARFYEELAAEKHKTNQLSHNVKNYLLAVSGFIQQGQNEEAMDYLQKLGVINDSNYCHITGSLPIDAVLAEKQRLAERQGTSLQVQTLLNSPLAADEVDVALVLATALDNALEATAALPQASIDLTYHVDAYYIDIIMTNTIAHKVLIENNTITTNKADKEHHGIGLASIKEIVERYDGSLELDSSDDTFTMDVLLGNTA